VQLHAKHSHLREFVRRHGGENDLIKEDSSVRYSVELISPERKIELAEEYADQVLYEVKSEIYGCCIKLLTGMRDVRNRWEDSFYFMSQSVRSHGRMYVVNEPGDKNRVLYDPQSKTAFLVNFDYYGWIKSLALSLAGDILEDEHGIHSVHGACLDLDGRGICIIGGSGTGKTTHTYGLLRDPRVRVVSDDWFFGRIYGRDVLGYGSEKNFYIRSELASIWKEFSWLVERAELDSMGRGVVDLRWAIGKGRILPLTTIRHVFILKRDSSDDRIVRLSPEDALQTVEKNGYFNPHLLVDGDLKRRIRSGFFRAMLSGASVWVVNTTGTPEETQSMIRDAIGV